MYGKFILELCLFNIIYHINSIIIVNDTNKNNSFYVLNNTNDTILGELLYVNLYFSNYSQNDLLSQKKAFYSISALWFTTTDLSIYDELYFGYGLTNENKNGTTFTDLILCHIDDSLMRCDDCYLNDQTNLSIIDSIKKNFTPNYDVEASYLKIKLGGKDNLFSYDLQDLITSNISPYTVLLKFSINKQYFAYEKFDLTFNKNINITFFYGYYSYDIDGNKNYTVFNILKKIIQGTSRKLSLLMSLSSLVKLSSVLLILYCITFI